MESEASLFLIDFISFSVSSTSWTLSSVGVLKTSSPAVAIEAAPFSSRADESLFGLRGDWDIDIPFFLCRGLDEEDEEFASPPVDVWEEVRERETEVDPGVFCCEAFAGGGGAFLTGLREPMDALEWRSLGDRENGLGLMNGSESRRLPFADEAVAVVDGGCRVVTTGESFFEVLSCVLVFGEGVFNPGDSPLGGEIFEPLPLPRGDPPLGDGILEPLPLPRGDPPWMLPLGDLVAPPGLGELAPLPLPEFSPPGPPVADVVLLMLDLSGETAPPLKLPRGEPLPPGENGEIWPPLKLPLGEPLRSPRLVLDPRLVDSVLETFAAAAAVTGLVPGLCEGDSRPLDRGEPDVEPGTDNGDAGLGL